VLCANDANLLGENKHTFCERSERGAVLVTGSEGSLVANGEGKGGKIPNPGGGNKRFECLNVWEQP